VDWQNRLEKSDKSIGTGTTSWTEQKEENHSVHPDESLGLSPVGVKKGGLKNIGLTKS